MEKIVEFIYIFIPIFLIIIMIYIMYKEKDIIKFNNLKLPKTEYLKGKYISGLNYKSGNHEILIYGFGSDGMVSVSKDIIKIIGSNMYLTFDKDILSIGIENNDGIFYDKINDIKEIKINIKPYNYIKMVQSDYEPNLSKTNGRSTGSVEHRNKVTVLKSYELNIITKDKNINLIVFKDPNIFFRR